MLIDKKGRRFHALVTELEQTGTGRFELGVRPLDSRISYRTATVREVIGVWRKARRALTPRYGVAGRRSAHCPSPRSTPGALEEARERTLDLVAPLSDADVETAHSALMSPLVWDLGHIAAYEDLWLVHRHGGEPLLHPELAAMYDAFETPRAVRGDLALLDRGEALDLPRGGPRARARGARPRGPGEVHEMVLQHEQQHNETMLQAIELARLGTAPGLAAVPRGPRRAAGHTGLEAIEVPGGRSCSARPTTASPSTTSARATRRHAAPS